MADVAVAILGLGRMGTSLGLALKRYNTRSDAKHHFRITGYANDSEAVKAAQKLSAVDEIARQPEDAVRGKDIILLAMPYYEVEGVYQYIGPDLRGGAVVVDFSPLKQPSMAWAAKHLPEGTHQIGVSALLNPKYLFDGVDESARASADYFDGGSLLLCPSVNCIPEAIELASDLAGIVGASAQFVDPAENDALTAGTESLPALIGLAYFQMMMTKGGWNDAQRLTNASFGALTRHLFDSHPDSLRDLWVHSREETVRYLDDLRDALTMMRDVLAAKDQDAVEAALEDASRQYESWYNRRLKNRWEFDEKLKPETGPLPNVVSTFFGSYLANKLRPRDQKKN